MTETETKGTCQCGMPMKPNNRGGRYCDNCDYPQPQEALGMSRRITSADIRRNMYWLMQESEYEDNTNVGSPNKEEDADEAADS